MSEKYIYTPNTCQVPNIIFDYWMSKLTDTQFKVLLAITRKTLGWQKLKDNISLSQIQELTGFKETAVREAIRQLEKLELIKTVLNRNYDGSCRPSTFILHIYEIKECSTSPAEPSHPPSPERATLPRQDEGTKPKTKPTDQKGNVLDEDQSLPFTKEEKGKTKFPLNKEQQPYLAKMNKLGLESDESTLMILIRTAFKEKKVPLLEKAISHLEYEIAKGTPFKKARIALFRSVLNGKVSPVSPNAQENKKFAEGIKKKFNWHSLEIKDKYVLCDKTQKEVPLDQPTGDFQHHLKNLYELSKQY